MLRWKPNRPTKTLRFHPTQLRFINSPYYFSAFTGGRGSGKSHSGAYRLLKSAKPNRLYMVAAPTYKVLKDASWRTLIKMARDLNAIRSLNKSDMLLTLRNGAEIIGRSAEEPDALGRGPNLSGVWMDEAGEMHEDAFDAVMPSLREGGDQGWLIATFTPRGYAHWTYKVFGSGKMPDAMLYRCSTRHNPFLPAGFYDRIKHRYGSARAAQELDGLFVNIEGAEFDSSWFDDSIWFDEWPDESQIVIRTLAWDPSIGKNSDRGDYSSLVELQLDIFGRIWVEGHLKRRNVDYMIDYALGLCEDRRIEAFGIEANGFQQLIAGPLIEKAKGRNIFTSVHTIENTINKQIRIRRLVPWHSRREVRYRNTPDTRLLVEQLQQFPEGDHDDGPDAEEMALRLALELQGKATNEYLSEEFSYDREFAGV